MSKLSWRWLCRNLATFALLLALRVLSGAPAPVAAWQTIPLTGASVASPPLTLVAEGEAVLPAGSTQIVWLVERQAGTMATANMVSSPLEYVLPRRDISRMHGEHGALDAASATAPVTRLTPAGIIPLYVATTDTDLTVRFALVPSNSVPPGAIASEPFTAPDGDRLPMELRQGLLAPGQQATVPASETPVVLLAVDNPLLVEPERESPITLARGELTLLAANSVIRNRDARVATFAVAWITPNAARPHPATAPREVTPGVGDEALDVAWQRFGCHLNPGNPACLTVGLAAACASSPSGLGCQGDSDADTCLDVAEVRAGLDPFEPADCIGGQDGHPLLNCLFLAGNVSCDGGRGATGEGHCSPATDPRRGPHLGDRGNCGPEPPVPDIDCQIFARDPACDGFAPQPR